MVLPSRYYTTIYWMSVSTNKTYWAMLSTGCWSIHCINQHPTIEKLAIGIFLVAVDGGWSDWSQWSNCTRNITGIQVRIRRCVNPNPPSGEKPCPGPDVTVIRGCTNISRCPEGISQMLKNLFAYYPTPPLTTFSVLFPVYLFGDFKQHNVLSDLTDSPPLLEQYTVIGWEDI